ncbi:unnamed protein product [Rhizophagus irregularis]|nr:unnamed protein product [Rhizophagus irregularis]
MLSCTTAKTMSSNVASSSTGATYNLMKGIDGDTFLDFTTADFEKCRIPSGPAKKIGKLIKEIQGEQPFAAMNPNDLAFVFIDNTNSLKLHDEQVSSGSRNNRGWRCISLIGLFVRANYARDSNLRINGRDFNFSSSFSFIPKF